MAFRQILLRVMLWSLAIAAGVVAFAAMHSQDDLVWRMVSTGIAATVTSASLLGFSALSEREKWRKAGLLGMGFVVFEFLLVLLFVWVLNPGGFVRKEQCRLTILLTAVVAMPAMIMLRMMETAWTRMSGIVGLASSAGVFVLLALALWTAERGFMFHVLSESLAASGGWLALFGAMTISILFNAGQDRRKWRYLGVLFAIVGFGVACWGVWWATSVAVMEPVMVLGALTGFFAVANPVVLCGLKRGQQWLRHAIVICAALGTVTVIASVLTAQPDQQNVMVEEMLLRSAAALGIPIACGCVALGVLTRLNRRVEIHKVMSEVREFTMICPGCGQKQTLPTGEASCGKCGLKIQTRFEEPRCTACGYLLYMLASDRCPECGTAVNKRAGTPNASAPLGSP